MRLKTNGQRFGVFGQPRAKGVFLFLAVMGQLPILQRTKRQGQSGGLGEDRLIIPEQPRPEEHVDKLLVRPRLGGRIFRHDD